MKKRQKRIGFLTAAILLLMGSVLLWGCSPKEDVSANKENEQPAAEKETGDAGGQDSPAQEETDGESNPAVAVASLSADGTDGSCVIWYVDGNQYIVATASHVVDSGTEKVLLDGMEVTVTGYYKSVDYDLAFLVMEAHNDRNVRGDASESVKLEKSELAGLYPTRIDVRDYEELEETDRVFIWGTVAGEKTSQEGKVLSDWIYIEDFGYHMIWAEAENIKGGMSGGGVFNGNGGLVGILLGSDGEGQIVALPLNIIMREWEKSDLSATIDISSN